MGWEYKYLKDPRAIRIFESVRDSTDEYTSDSAESKFLMLPERIGNLVYLLSRTFASLTFYPNFPVEKVQNLKVFYLYYVIILAGIQIYLKDQSLMRDTRSYVWEEREEEIKKTSQELWKFLTRRLEVEKYLRETMDETVYMMKTNAKEMKDFHQKQYKLLKRELNKWCDVSVLSGYFLAKSLAKHS